MEKMAGLEVAGARGGRLGGQTQHAFQPVLTSKQNGGLGDDSNGDWVGMRQRERK